MPITVRGAPAAAIARSIVGESILASPTTATRETRSSAEARPGLRVRGRLGVRPPRWPCPRRAGSSRGGARSARTRTRPTARPRPRRQRRAGHVVAAARRGGGEGGQDERKGRERHQRGERRARPLDAEGLLAVVEPPHQQADAHHAVADDHDGREDGVARQLGRAGAAGEHHRQDQRGLDHGDGHGQDERAEGLAHAVRHDLGVVHGQRRPRPRASRRSRPRGACRRRPRSPRRARPAAIAGTTQVQAGIGRPYRVLRRTKSARRATPFSIASLEAA